MNKNKITLPKAGDSKILPGTEEQTYLMETGDGLLISVPESGLDAFFKAQEEEERPWTDKERQTSDARMPGSME